MKSLLALIFCVMAVVSSAYAQTWRMGLELVDQWSLFTCTGTGSLTDRFWEFTVEGSQLKANGPDGVSWATTINSEGAFQANFTGYYRPRSQSYAVEMKGNMRTDPPWAMLHNVDYMCWYKLVPKQ